MGIDAEPAIAISPITVREWHSGDKLAPPLPEGVQPPRSDLDFASLARGRHVVRQFKPISVPRELVEMTIEAAGWAPSPHGAKPWRFVVGTRLN